MRIFLVVGSSGEYSDYRTWNVCAWSNEEVARAHAAKLNDKAKEVAPAMRSYRPGDYHAAKAVMQAEDPSFTFDHLTGVSYDVEEIELRL